MRCRSALLLSSLALSLSSSGFAQSEAPLQLQTAIKIEHSLRVSPGEYNLAPRDGYRVQVSGQNIVVDFAGASLEGGDKKGTGILIKDAKNVTIKNANVYNCLWGILIERSEGVKLINCTTSYNGILAPGTVIDESGEKPEDQWGGGILVRDSSKCLIQKCRSMYQWDGIDVIRSSENVIEGGDFSYNGNWGVHFWASSNNTFKNNKAIWCTTGAGTLFQALTGWQTYDAQAVAIDHNSNENLIEGNDLRFGGDAIFIRANEGPIAPGTVVPPKNASNRNILRNNDCSFSPNNAIEVDLVDDTIIEGNNCSNSNYGMWLGYSRRTQVRNNTVINCSRRAVEIENGQDGVFEGNVFGFDKPRPDTQLIYLRQNGRDKTRSGGYVFTENLFYGVNTAVLLKGTDAKFEKNISLPAQKGKGVMFLSDATSKGEEFNTITRLADDERRPVFKLPGSKQISAKPGSFVTIYVSRAPGDRVPPVIELDGTPVWTTGVSGSRVTFRLPEEFWDRPSQSICELRSFGGVAFSEPIFLKILWDRKLPRIDAVSPNPAEPNDKVTVIGENLDGGRILLNGKPAELLEATDARMILKLPAGLLTSTRMNLMWERGEGAKRAQTAPVLLTVELQQAQQPHIISAEFSPERLHVGDVLTVKMRVKNNLSYAVDLMPTPKPDFMYEEKQGYDEVGVRELPGTLHLRVTSDKPAERSSGSWPWMFGFEKARLRAGETTTVNAKTRLITPGEIEFRVGLVARGVKFLDDNLYRTIITVLP